MGRLRAALRLTLAVGVVAAFFLLWFLGMPFVAFSSRAWARWRAWTLRVISRCLLRILGVRVEVGVHEVRSLQQLESLLAAGVRTLNGDRRLAYVLR